MKRFFLFSFFLFFIFSEKVFSENEGVKIQSIMLTSDRDYLKESYDGKGIFFEKIKIPNQKLLRRKLSKFLNENVTDENIEKIRKTVVEYFEKDGSYFVVVKEVKDRDIILGKIKIFVLMGNLGKINVEGNKYFSEKNIKKGIKTKENEVIDLNQMKKDLIWLNKNPFREVSLVYEPGKEFGNTDINLLVKDYRPFQIYAGYNRTGYQIAGSSRFLVGFNAGNFLGTDHQLNAQFMSADDVDKWWGVSGFYIAPFPHKDTFKFFWNYIISKPPQKDDPNMNLTGKALNFLFRYHVFLPLFDNYNHEFIMGYDFKKVNNFLSVQEDLIFDDYMDISQFVLQYEAEAGDKYGLTAFGVHIFISPGKMTHYNKTRFFEAERPGAKAHYIYGDIRLKRNTKLPRDFSWIAKALFQASSEKLLPTEQLSLGGMNSIRGYKENEVIGDKGGFLINEIRTKVFDFKVKNIENNLQFLGFLDFGVVSDVDQNILSKDSAVLFSIGPGLRYTIEENFNLSFDYGFQLKSVHGRVFGSGRDSRGHLNLNVSF